MKTFYRSAIVLFISALIISACAAAKPGYDTNDEKSAAKVVETFHQLYNEQNYGEIFNTAHENARGTKSKEALGLALAEAFEKYGKHVSSELVYKKTTVLDEKERQVEFAFRSKFEKGSRNETFMIIATSEKAELHSIGELTDEQLKALK